MSAEFRGMRQLTARITALKDIPRSVSREWQVRTIAGAKVRVRRKTGHTGRTIGKGPVTDQGASVTAAGAAVYLEKGTKPHDIRPKRAKALRFPAKGAQVTLSGRPRRGEPVVFAKRVRHPGTRKYPFLLPAAQEALKEVGVDSAVKLWNDAA